MSDYVSVQMPGEPEPTRFSDVRTAALYLLVSANVPVTSFVFWALKERSFILNKPAACTANAWKFALLQDHSLTQLKEYVESAGGAAAIPDLRVPQTPPCAAKDEASVATLTTADGATPPPASAKRRRSTPTEPAKASRAESRRRGSSRRIPEKENVTECPECGRRGQSIFDPSISDREGHVWQYFYCRNTLCPKGRSCNRYIGWAIRPIDR